MRVLIGFLLSIVWSITPLFISDASAEEQVNTATGIESVYSSVKKLIDDKSIAGATVMISHKGQIIHYDAQGFRDIAEQAPLKKDDIFRIYSMTKPITSVAALMLAEEGKLDLDAPVAHYLPELANLKVWKPGRNKAVRVPITIRHLMTHTAGFTYGFFSATPVDIQYNMDHPLFSTNNSEMVAKLAQYPLLFQPGKKWHYSVATDVLGHVIERVSGVSLGTFFKTRIFEPLNMVDTDFFISQDDLHRFTSVYKMNLKPHEPYNTSDFQIPDRIESGGGGLVSTAQDYMNFCQMLLDGGVFHGERLLSEAMIKEMTRNQLPDGVLAYGYFGFGLGVQIQLSNWGDKAHEGEYGWSGAASTHFWISPTDELIVIALAQRQPFSKALKNAIKADIYRSIQ
ncbi:MAG: serine hydrolase domain-containing protein [Myxococcota bacterium]|nr:serine hydrolase domain-containing protein [Myxococcota bacterium]